MQAISKRDLGTPSWRLQLHALPRPGEQGNGGWIKIGLDEEDVYQQEVRENKEPGGTEDVIPRVRVREPGEIGGVSRGQIVQSLPRDLDFPLKTAGSLRWVSRGSR